MEIVIQSYKTDKRYKTIKKRLSEELFEATQAYMEKFDIQLGKYLFKKKNLSTFVSNMNQKLGYKKGVTLFRNMKVTEEWPNLSVEERIALAKEMGHSPVMQKTYLRQKGLI